MPSLPPTANPPSTNPHLTDPILQPFLGPSFDPTAYLNNILPPLAIPTTAQPIIPSKSLSVADLSSRTQTHVAQLSAQTTRLSSLLTELTDAILRSGPRLAYNVELLRGEANALADAMADTLSEEIREFAPNGLDPKKLIEDGDKEEESAKERERSVISTNGTKRAKDKADPIQAKTEPPDLARLRTLHHVRLQLQTVISTFDKALSWPLPPSSLSIAQSLVSVSAPQSSTETTSLEERGQAAQNDLRESVMELLSPGGRSAGAEGVLQAEQWVAELRDLARVWKGTAEEKARIKFVDGLERIVAERRAEEERKGGLKTVEQERATGSGQDTARATEKKGGLFGGLRRLREEIYLE